MQTDPGAPTIVLSMAEAQDELLPALRADLAKDYEIEALIGRGGMAVVYRAIEKDLHRTVALKVLPPGTAAAMAERFKREARVAANLDHPNVVPIYRVGQAANTQYFAMKFVEGRPLDAILESQGALPVSVILAILRGAVAGLAYAHDRRVVHRDIKGANVLIERDGRVMLSDLGIARAIEDKGLTATGAVMGTPHFMSPEQCSGQKVGPQTDQYSMGVLAFQMVTGQVPFDADNLMGILHHHFFTPVPDISRVREGVPPLLTSFILKALEKNPANRWDSTRDMLHAVEAMQTAPKERQAAEELLSELAQGTVLPQVRTGTIPPLPPTPTLHTLPQAGSAMSTPERESAAAAIRASVAAAPAPGPVVVTPESRRTTTPAGAPAPRKSRGGLIAALLVLVVAGGGAAVFAARGSLFGTAADSTATADSLAAVPAAAPVDSAAQARADSLRRDSAAAAVGVALAESTRVADSVRVADSARTADSLAALARTRGSIRLVGDIPSGSRILIDGRRVSGRTHVLSGGAHDIEIQAAGFQVYEETIVVEGGASTDVEVALEPFAGDQAVGRAFLSVVAVPPGASIAIDGSEAGTGEVSDAPIAAGRRVRVTITAPGYRTWDSTIVASPAEVVNLRVRTLRPQP